MSLMPAFELGLWNAWIFEVLSMTVMVPAYLIDKKALKRFQVVPSHSKTEKTLYFIAKNMGFITLVYSFFLPFRLGTVWFYVGLLIFLLSYIMGLGIINFVTASPFEPVTKGVYHLSRNPVYFSEFLLDISIGIACASWIFLLSGTIFIILTNMVVVSEERFCLKKYGDSYREYLDRTPRWIGIPKSRNRNSRHLPKD